MGKIKIVLSFDDGRKDNFEIVKPMLEKYGLTATFNIATAYVDGSIPDKNRPCLNLAMSVDNVKELYNSGFEIAGHGDNHLNTEEDMYSGLDKLSDWLEFDKKKEMGFASPESALKAQEILRNKDIYNKRISYVRIGIVDADSAIKKIERKLAHLSGNKRLFFKAFEKSLGRIENFIVYSIPIMHDATAGQVIYLLEKAIKSGKNCVLMFHSILRKGDAYYQDTWSWDEDRFEILCKWLYKRKKENIIVVCNTHDLLCSN